MPRVSVLTITWRLGGFDLLGWGLDRQTFEDFDLVVVDALAARRAEEIARWAAQRRFSVRHLGDGRAASDLAHRESTAYNTGLAACTGEYVLFLSDWTALTPWALARHVEAADRWRQQAAVMADYTVHDLPEHLAWPRYAWINGSDAGAYATMLDDLLETSPLWTRSGTVPPASLLSQLGPRTRGRFVPLPTVAMGFVSTRYTHLKNEMYPRAVLEAAGGFDLAYDGAHGYMDADMGQRLAAHGLRFWSDPDATATHVDPRRWMRTMRNDRWRENEARLLRVQGAP